MSISTELLHGGLHVKLIPVTTTITTALSGTIFLPTYLTSSSSQKLPLPVGMNYLGAEAQFTYGSGGTTVDVYLQTSFDAGLSWVDIINFHFTTSSANKVASVSNYVSAGVTPVGPTDAGLTSNTVLTGVLGDQFRAKLVTTGTYAGGTTIRVDAIVKS